MKTRTVRIGLVGAGHMNNTYARCLLDYNRDAELVAVAGGSRTMDFAAEYGIDAERDVGSLLSRSDIDAVIIATPLQEPAAGGQFLARGAHMFDMLLWLTKQDALDRWRPGKPWSWR